MHYLGGVFEGDWFGVKTNSIAFVCIEEDSRCGNLSRGEWDSARSISSWLLGHSQTCWKSQFRVFTFSLHPHPQSSLRIWMHIARENDPTPQTAREFIIHSRNIKHNARVLIPNATVENKDLNLINENIFIFFKHFYFSNFISSVLSK